jgi:hypothetical protein
MSTPSAEKSDPALWKRIVARVKRGEKGGDAGQWSARKAQLATAEYQKAGGGYAGGQREDTHLAQWGAEHQDDKPAPKRIPAAKPDPVVAEFRRLVNMNRTTLSRWLATKRSQAAGLRKGGAYRVGRPPVRPADPWSCWPRSPPTPIRRRNAPTCARSSATSSATPPSAPRAR